MPTIASHLESDSGERAFELRLAELSESVTAFWGQGVQVAVEGQVPCYDWNIVRISSDCSDKSDLDLECLLAHEIGHRTIAPRTVEQAYWWQVLARYEGIRQSADAVNIAADLLVDEWYLRHPDWGTRYERSLTSELEELRQRWNETPGQSREPVAWLLLSCYSELVTIGPFAEEQPSSQDSVLAKKAVETLLSKDRTLEDRVRAFFRRTAPVFEKARAVRAELLLVGGRRKKGGTGFMRPVVGSPHPWHGKKWRADELIRLLASSGMEVPQQWLREICGGRIAHRVGTQLRILESLMRVAQKVNQLVAAHSTRQHHGFTEWNPGDPARELDRLASLERFGALLPGITTLRRPRSGSPVSPTGLPSLCLIVDNSGSTAGAILRSELDAAIGLLEAARQLRTKVSTIVFGTGIAAAIPPGEDFDRIERLLAGLRGESGGTNLAPALGQAVKWLPQDGSPLGTVIFTDSYIFDTDSAKPHLQTLCRRGPVILFCVESSLDRDLLEIVEAVEPKPRLVRFHPGQPLIDAALEIFQ